jgi:hypothetical protein
MGTMILFPAVGSRAQLPGTSVGLEGENALVDRETSFRPREVYGEPIFSCNFDDDSDRNHDRWPDGWSRRRGYGYPDYLEIQIESRRSPAGPRCLEADMQGGGVAVYSPPIPVHHLLSYVLDGLVLAEGLKHDDVYLTLSFLDEKEKVLKTFATDVVRETHGWKRLTIGPIAANDSGAAMARIGLHVQPGRRQDLQGQACFSKIELFQCPTVELSTNNRYQIFTDPSKIEVKCLVSGLFNETDRITFQLEDAFGTILAEVAMPIEMVHAPDELYILDESLEKPLVQGKTSWKPPIQDPGFYRVRVHMPSLAPNVDRNRLTFVVLEPKSVVVGGEFGWSFPNRGRPYRLLDLRHLINHAGISRVKYPVWLGNAASEKEWNDLSMFCEWLAFKQIHIVGLLSDPPEEVREQLTFEDVTAATVFSMPRESWYPSVEPTMLRLAMLVHWWQLGNDEDRSMIEIPRLQEQVGEIKKQLDEVGFDVMIGFGWDWIDPLPPAENQPYPWHFLTFSNDLPLTYQQLGYYLDGSRKQGIRSWVTLQPISKTTYTMKDRLLDLLRRMMAAKIHQADAIFLPKPFDDDCGVMNEDGSPGELFLPWRTTANLLAKTKFAGSIEMPGGSKNLIFQGEEGGILVVWNENPTEEVIFLGKQTEHIDVWGKRSIPLEDDFRQVIPVGSIPSFVTGVNMTVTRWRQGCRLARDSVPSMYGTRTPNAMTFHNNSFRGMAGTATFEAPKAWNLDPPKVPLLLGPDEKLEEEFTITLTPKSTSGPQPFRIDLQLEASKVDRFSIYRRINVGLGDVYIDTMTRLNRKGQLEVHQAFINESEKKVNFACTLYAPGRQLQKSQVIGLSFGRIDHVYRLDNGDQLLGKNLRIIAKELGGSRMLKYEFPASR